MPEMIGRDLRTRVLRRVVAERGLIVSLDAVSPDAVEGDGESEGILAAGLVDLQVNGVAGFDVNAAEVSVATVEGMVEAMLARGVTCFLPTLITASEEFLCHALSVISEARQLSARTAAAIPCVHLEGPHISARDGYRGAHPAAAVRPPSIAEFERWQAASGGLVGMVTLSPHQPEARAYIEHLVARGVHVSLGHTHSTPQEIAAAVAAGAKLSTHLGNGIAQEIPRHANPLWAQLVEDRLTATVIADGQHLPPEMLRAFTRAKGLERMVLVSDSVALAGMPPGRYTTAVGGDVELREDGRLCLPGTDLLAGSTASLLDCIPRMAAAAGIPLAEAFAMATEHPGRFVGNRGRLEVGLPADVVRFHLGASGAIEHDEVWLRGEAVWKRDAGRGRKS